MDLIVEIPKKFKKQLEKRFDETKFEENKDRIINIKINTTSCPLCAFYKRCSKCPFYKFSFSRVGCRSWIEEILFKKYENICFHFDGENIFYFKNQEKRAIKQLKYLKKQAKKYIRWM